MLVLSNRINLCLFSVKRPSLPFKFDPEENILGQFFASYQGFPYSHKQSMKRMVNTLLMVQRINLCCSLIFILYKKKNFCQKIVKKKSLWYNELLNMFFLGVAIEIAVLVSWYTTPVSLCYSNDLQLEKCSRKCCFGFCTFGFEELLLVYIAYPWR